MRLMSATGPVMSALPAATRGSREALVRGAGGQGGTPVELLALRLRTYAHQVATTAAVRHHQADAGHQGRRQQATTSPHRWLADSQPDGC